MKKLLVALSLLAAGTAGASAADLAVKAPAMPVPYVTNWTGFYVGGNAGYGWGTANIRAVENAPAPFDPLDTAAISNAASLNQRANGFTGGGQAGYNWQIGAAVLGAEVDFNAFHLRGSNTSTAQFPSTLPGGTAGPPAIFFTQNTNVSTDWLFTARERIGWANDHWLLYGTGGLAVTNLNVNQSVAMVAPFVFNTPVSSTRVGWTAGAGFEYAVDRSWSVKGEYLYLDFGTVAGTGVLSPTPFAGLTYTNSTHLTANVARLGVNYHFDSPVVARY